MPRSLRLVLNQDGGVGAIHTLAHQLGLPHAIDQRLHLLNVRLPYHESGHVLNIAYHARCHGTCLQDIELRRNDEAFLDALGARRIPDPTTAGDSCRRFSQTHIGALQTATDETRRNVWAEQPKSFFNRPTIGMDGTRVGTTGSCKAGMGIAYDGTWGHHPLVISLAGTGEALRLLNRSGSRPPHDQASGQVDQAIWLCMRSGFRRMVLRGDTDFSQTRHLGRWPALPGVDFIFGYDARSNLIELAERLPATARQPLDRPARYEVQTQPRKRPGEVRERIVRERKADVLRSKSEEVAECGYRPSACANPYRMAVIRKRISKEKGEHVLLPEVRYVFSITNDRKAATAEGVFEASERCDQENVLAQLHGGVRASSAPVNTPESNGAWMAMTALAWNLKAWWALVPPESPGRRQGQRRGEKRRVLRSALKSFVSTFVTIPCAVAQTGRTLVLRVPGWNPYWMTFFRLVSRWRE